MITQAACVAMFLIGSINAECSPLIPVEMFPNSALITVYDTELGGMNGNGDGYFASMTPISDEWYGVMAACPPQLFGEHLELSSIGTVWCGDNFGTLDGEPVQTVTIDYIRVDIFYPVLSDGYPEWNYWTVDYVAE